MFAPVMYQGFADYRYELVSFRADGSADLLDSGGVSFDLSFGREGHQFDAEAIAGFFWKLLGILQNSTVLMSTENGEFQTGIPGLELLLHRQRRRRPWRALLAAAAVIGALAAGLSVGAGDRTNCQIYWSQTNGELRYVVRLEHVTTQPFQDAQLDYVPEGFTLVRGGTNEIRGERRLIYRKGEEASFTLRQTRGEDLVGSKGTACQGSEVEVNGRPGLLAEETGSTEKDLLWTDGPYIFALYGKGLSAEELLRIAEGVTW